MQSQRPCDIPVCSPQSNGMAESFVNTFKRDYVARMDRRDAQTVLAQLPAAFEHFNEAHPTLGVENAVTSGVQTAAGRPGASGTINGRGALLRLRRGWKYGGNIICALRREASSR